MSDKSNKSEPAPIPTSREDRLKAALKANIAKRKAQTRARAASPNKKEKE